MGIRWACGILAAFADPVSVSQASASVAKSYEKSKGWLVSR